MDNKSRPRLLKLFSFTTPFMIASFLATPYKYKRNINKYFLMIYLLGNNIPAYRYIHIHMKIYSFRIRLETYKNLKLKIAQKVVNWYLL